jgi:hypothetical protein
MMAYQTASATASLIDALDPGAREDLCNYHEFHLPSTRDSLDPVSWGGGDAQVSQQSMNPTNGDWGFNTEGFPFISISIPLLTIVVAQGRVVLIVFIFVVDIVVLLLQLLLLSRYALSCSAPKYH